MGGIVWSRQRQQGRNDNRGIAEFPQQALSTGSQAPKAPKASRSAPSWMQSKFPGEYTVGEKLGEGAFGTVYRCRRQGSHNVEQLAVKMIDKVETPMEDIRKEVEIQARLNHPNIVKVFGIYDERCFVCLVMTLCEGRDLVDGLQLLKKVRTRWECLELIHCYRPLAAAVQYLHSKKVIHRDLKGDNYLLDRTDISDPQCHISLSDFGSALVLKSLSDRMTDQEIGTKTYWAPELCVGNYGIKVDVWALGVVMYGLLEGRLPFRDQEGIRRRRPQFPESIHPVCHDLLVRMLAKSEQERLDIEQVMSHQWLVRQEWSKQQDEANDMVRRTSTDGKEHCHMERDGARDHIAQRRAMLVNRTVQQTQQPSVEAKNALLHTIHGAEAWVVTENKFSPGCKMKYEWCDPAKANQLGVFVMGRPSQIDVDDQSPDMIRNLLQEHNIDPALYGQGPAKLLDNIASEVQTGVSRLMLDAEAYKKLVRVVDVVLLRIHAGTMDGPVLVHTEAPSGQDKPDWLPSSSWKPHENPQDASRRIMADLLGMEDIQVEFDYFARESFKEETQSPEYPGLQIVYRKQIITGVVKEMDMNKLARIGVLPRGKFRGKTRNEFMWIDASQLPRRRTATPVTSYQSLELSSIVDAPLGMNDQMLQDLLESNNIDFSAFGKGQSKTFEELCEELRMGTARLHADPSGKVRRVCDIVLLHITDERGRLLIESEQTFPDGSTKALNRLPGEKRRPDENPFYTAWQIVSEHLKTDTCFVALGEYGVECFEEEKESVAFPGIATLYRKHLIKGLLLPRSSHKGSTRL